MLRFLTAGESHGPVLTVIMEGLPAGVPVSADKINRELARRQSGFGRGGRMLIEKDQAEIVSGVRFGRTLGSPVTLQISNRDWVNWQSRMSVSGTPGEEPLTRLRPGHADLPGVLKYGHDDVRNVLERASARETAARTAAGALAKQLLGHFDIQVVSYVSNIGGISIDRHSYTADDLPRALAASRLSCPDPLAEARMLEVIETARQNGDTLGGSFVVRAEGLLPGLGSYVQWDRRLDGRLGAAILSIPAIKGVEFGLGFQYAGYSGRRAHDVIEWSDTAGYRHASNHAGGLEGGMTNGEAICLQAVMKPIPTLGHPLPSVDLATHAATPAAAERSDVCAVPAAAVVAEAMTALILADAWLDKFGGDCLEDIERSVDEYRRRISG